jgi:carboxyl-terminal processing protease
MRIPGASGKTFTTSLLIGGVIFLAGFAAGTISSVISAQGSGVSDEAREAFSPVWDVLQLIQDQYIDDVPAQALADGALHGMVDALGDQFSGYMSPDEYDLLSADLSGEIEGIGVVIRTDEAAGIVEVVGVLDGAPAQSAGVLPGDVFVAIDGAPVEQMNQLELAGRVRGPEGTVVSITMRRGDELIDFDITRARITIPNVESRILDGDIAYVRLNQFADSSREDIDRAFEELDVRKRAGLIFDLRDNPGGLLTAAIDVASAFIPDGTIVTERFGDGRETVFSATGAYANIQTPIVVLVNEGSASASELVSGAMQDRGVATVLGTTTFGKGTVQTWNDLSNGGGVRLTIARWLTPNGRWINEAGITPDVIVEWTPLHYGDPDDRQLERAAELIQRGDVAAPEDAPGLPADALDNAA